jgi:hypothetical protein
MQTSSVSFTASATGPDLGLTVRFDGKEIYSSINLPLEPTVIAHEFDDTEEIQHTVEIEMSGKMPDHTTVTESGEITADRVVEIQDVKLDDIELGYMFTKVSEYHHDTNGNSKAMIDKFHGIMGCNGVVRFQFTSPLYLWLLENM